MDWVCLAVVYSWKVTQHIDAGNAEAAIAAHGVANGLSLIPQRRFAHYMARKCEAMIFTPCAYLTAIGFYETVGQKVLELPSYA